MPKSKPLHEMTDAELKQEFLSVFKTLDPATQMAINGVTEVMADSNYSKNAPMQLNNPVNLSDKAKRIT